MMMQSSESSGLCEESLLFLVAFLLD